MRLAVILSLCLFLSPARAADAPRVAVDIAPVHSLVAQVMAGIGAPALILPPGASPHHHAMRPSEARALEDADLVVWMGQGLTPWLGEAVENLAPGARQIVLLEADQTRLLPRREGVAFDHDDHAEHDDHPDHDDQSGHNDHADHGDHAGHDDHADHAGHDGHDHAGHDDPHAWLDPANARAWLGLIAEELAILDPANAGQYRANARAAAEDLTALEAEVSATLAPVSDLPFLVLHDAYHYFEKAFGLQTAAAISLSDAARPGPARIAGLRELVTARGIGCVLTEPQLDPKLAGVVLDGTFRTGTVDPMGAAFDPGPAQYALTLRALAEGFAGCAG